MITALTMGTSRIVYAKHWFIVYAREKRNFNQLGCSIYLNLHVAYNEFFRYSLCFPKLDINKVVNLGREKQRFPLEIIDSLVIKKISPPFYYRR